LSNPLQIGVIGLGHRSKLITEYGHPETATITAVSDLAQEHLDAYEADAFKTRDYRELLARKDVDAVFIITPDHVHEDIAIDTLEAGKAVYLEKPMAITIEGCDRILETAYRTGSKLFLGHNMRYMPFVLKMKEIIDSGMIGTIQAAWCRHFIGYGGIYFHTWCSERKNSTGLLLQKGAHDIDVIHWLAGGYSQHVAGMGRLSVYNRGQRRAENENKPADLDEAWKEAWKPTSWPPTSQTLAPHMDIEDHNMLLMQLDNGVQASYVQCHYTPDTERNYTFIGDQGRVENIGDGGHSEIHVWTKRGGRSEPDIVYKLKPQPGTHGGADPLIVDAFVDFVKNDVTPNVSPVAARNAVAAGVCGHESMRNDNIPKDVPQPADKLVAYFDHGQIKSE
jgi:predicted dehydrogenase